MSILSTEGLQKRYKGTTVVKGVDINVETGEVVGLLGPNGAGKTTCFYMIVGLVRPGKGNIWLDDVEITGMAMHRRARLGIGYLPQEPSVFRKLTVEENIMAVLEVQPDLSEAECHERVDNLLEEFNIEHKRDALGS